jgi:mono/diheme cytochrome c family protein
MGALGVFVLGAATITGLLFAGAIDVAADVPHSPVVHRLIEWARERSIAHQAADIALPHDLSDAKRMRRGAGNYDAMCANCHLSPGVEDTEIRKGLYPVPPNFSKPLEMGNSRRTDAQRFWIIKHGLKASAMPAWSKGGIEDEAIWDLVALLKVLQSLSPEQYHEQVEMSDGHSHIGIEGHSDEKEAQRIDEHRHDAEPHTHRYGAHKH